MTKKEKVIEILKQFKTEYGDADCSLNYKTPFELLVSVQLAAQCTDARVNLVTPDLFRKYPTVYDFAKADLADMEEAIKSTGFYHNKAKNLIACAKRLVEVYGGEVPDTMEDLLTLAGVGRKSANLILGDIFGKPAIVVDTHCKRICNLIGLTKNQDPTKIEFDLKKIVPAEEGSLFCHQLVWHGRACCIARRPKCDLCCIRHVCDYAKNLI